MDLNENTSFQKAIDAVESLPIEDREEVIEILRLRLTEIRRDEIAANARETIQAVREGRAKYGDVEDLKNDSIEE